MLTEYTQLNITTDEATWTPPGVGLSSFSTIARKLDDLIKKCCSAKWQFRPLMESVVSVLVRLLTNSQRNSDVGVGVSVGVGVGVGSLTHCPKQQKEIAESKEPSAKLLPAKNCFSGRNIDASFFGTPKKRGRDKQKDEAKKKSKQEGKYVLRKDCIDKEVGSTGPPTLSSVAVAAVALFPECLPDDVAIDVGVGVQW
jgi:hypothetical protein